MPTQDPTAPPVDELRIHGVSGSPGPRLLGYESSAGTELLAPRPSDTGACVVRRRRDRAKGVVDGFDWGAVNSTSWRVTAWVFLLPFCLLNASGWMLPAAHRSKWHLSRVLVAAVGLTLTATWTVWLTNVLVNYVAFQNLARKVEPGATYAIGPYHHEWHQPRRDLVILAYVVLAATIGLVAYRSRVAPDRRAPRPAFFPERGTWLTSWEAHLGVAVVSVGATVVPAFHAVRSPSFDRSNHLVGIDLAGLVLGIAFAQSILVALLWVASSVVPMLKRQPRGPAAAAATLACLLSGAFLSGAALWITSALPKLLGVPFFDAGRGSDLGSADYYGWTLFAGAIGAAVAFMIVKRRAPTTPMSDALFPRWRRVLPTLERRAYVARRFDVPLAAFALVAGAVLVALAFEDVRWSRSGLDLTASTSGVMANFARWALPLGAVGAVGFVARNTFGGGQKKAVSIVWDVLTFFPREFHPLAVRCYAHEVVPRFSAAIEERTQSAEDRLLVSAHSQGSVITYAALHELPIWSIPKIALVTYGCPIATLYGRNFPALFDDRRSRRLANLIGGRWHNYFRFTDPIGGPVFVADEQGQAYGDKDQLLPDPATATPTPNPSDAPLEHDREPQMYLALHSYYLREAALKHRVAAVRSDAW